MPAGRPTSYNKEAQRLADEYADTYASELGQVVPSIEGLALHIGVSRKTLYNWAECADSDKFLHTFERVKASQAVGLINKGLTGEFNATIAKLMLHGHGHSDKQEVDHTSSDKSMSPPGVTYKLTDE